MKPRVLCVAPMIDWTDRHCRRFHRELTQHTWLYSEMVTTGALVFGDRKRFLRHSEEEHPVAFQLGGSDPFDLARCAAWVQEAGYDEVNLNCGCPSERVQKGAFGACLMAEPQLVAECVDAMRQACNLEVTVKHRIGLNEDESEQMLFDFVGAVSEAGCQTFVVHARNAILKGLSPKQNREIPPLRYALVQKLKLHFPTLQFVLNGGIQTMEQIRSHLSWADGVMVGRQAYHDPWLLTEFDSMLNLDQSARKPVPSRQAAIENLRPYVESEIRQGEQLRNLSRSWLGLFHGQPGGRLFRQVLSDATRLKSNDWHVVEEALACTRNF